MCKESRVKHHQTSCYLRPPFLGNHFSSLYRVARPPPEPIPPAAPADRVRVSGARSTARRPPPTCAQHDNPDGEEQWWQQQQQQQRYHTVVGGGVVVAVRTMTTPGRLQVDLASPPRMRPTRALGRIPQRRAARGLALPTSAKIHEKSIPLSASGAVPVCF